MIERAPDNIRAHFNLGLVFLRLEDYPQAIGTFERVLALDEQMTDARFNLGFAYAKMGRYDEATRQYGLVVDQAPAYLDEVLFNLAIVQDFQGDRQAAARSLHGALRYNPHNVRAISYLARMEGRFSSPP
jgi:tetratricopeptide (TPR) repeat protein